MDQQEITFPCRARYFKSGELTQETKGVWFVLHGYGQLSQYFIRKFQKLKEHNICVIAPEGLSRFYLEDVSSRVQSGNNRVGATWMTRENRAMDIDNYLHYLDALVKHELNMFPDVPVTVLGFSQGAATASRWVLNGSTNAKQLILWAGIFPPDMNMETGKEILQRIKTILVYGETDPFLNDDRFAEMNLIAEKLNIKPVVYSYAGGHEIHEETLLKLVNV